MRFDDYLHQHERWNDNDAFGWFCYKDGIPNEKFNEKNMSQRDKDAIKNGEFMFNLVETRESLDITDVIPYFNANLGNMQMRELDGLNSPWNSTFVEWAIDTGSPHYRNARDNWGVIPRRIGVAVLCVDALNFAKSLNMRRQVALSEIKDISITEEEVIQAWRKYSGQDEFTDEMILSVAWHVAMFPFVLTDFGVLGPIGEFKMFLDEDGKFVIIPAEIIGDQKVVALHDGDITIEPNNEGINSITLWPEWAYPNTSMQKIYRGMGGHSWMTSPGYIRHRASLVGYITPAFYAFHHLNYRNIEAGKVQGRYDTPREARNRPPARSYHILKLRPVSARKSSSRPFSEVVGNMPLHTVRGCHHHYGPKYGRGLLFGRLEGKFFVPPHVRGSAKHGIVNKDYELTGVNNVA